MNRAEMIRRALDVKRVVERDGKIRITNGGATIVFSVCDGALKVGLSTRRIP